MNNKAIPALIVIAIAVFAMVYFFWDIVHLLTWIVSEIIGLLFFIAKSVIQAIFYVLSTIFWMVVDIYKSLIVSHPIIFVVCCAIIYAIARLIPYKLNYTWLFALAPIFTAMLGDFLSGGVSINISVTNAGLLLCTVTAVFLLYYVLIKTRIIQPGGASTLNKILNHSFVVVLVLMIGAFGIIAIDKLEPLIKHGSA